MMVSASHCGSYDSKLLPTDHNFVTEIFRLPVGDRSGTRSMFSQPTSNLLWIIRAQTEASALEFQQGAEIIQPRSSN